MTFLSESKKFIFIHIPKNAGTSIKQALSKNLKNEIELFPKTNIKIFDRYITAILHASARNNLYLPCSKLQYKYYKNMTHLSYSELENSIYEFSEYKKFCFVRNPFSRQVSIYNFMRSSAHFRGHVINKMNFEEYIYWRCLEKNIDTQSKFIKSRDGKIKIMNIFKLEELPEKWNQIMNWLELPEIEIKRLNTTSNDPNSYKEYFNEDLRKLIVENFHEDFDNFNYSEEI